MLLETFSATGDNVLLYSENSFDTLENFHIVYKQTLSKKPEPLSLVEVIQYINMPADKNLIVYRLLTNLRGFNSHAAKYGLIIKIDNIKELVYLDPVYAIREMEEIAESLDSSALRFRIQQVGLHSTAGMKDVYNEVYSFDLMAEEARNQNDRVFAEAVYAFDESFQEDNMPNLNISEVHDLSPNRTEDLPATDENEAVNSGEELVLENTDEKVQVPENISDQCNSAVLIKETEDLMPDSADYSNVLPVTGQIATEAEEMTYQHPEPAVIKIIVETSDRIANPEVNGFFFSTPSLNRDISDGLTVDPETLNYDPSLRKRRINTGLPAEYIAGGLLSESGPNLQDVNHNNSEKEEGTSGQMTFRDFLARRQFQENAMQEKTPSAGDDGILNIFKSSAGIGSYLNSRKQQAVVLKLEEPDQT